VRVKIKNSAFRVIKDLGEDVMSRIDSRLISGEGGLVIARYLQEDLKLLTKMARPSLQKTLERYRTKELRQRTLERIANVQSGVQIKAIAARLNALDELEEMTRHQRIRVDKLLVKETQMPAGILIKDTTREISLLKDMLVDLGKMQMDTGFMARAPKIIKGSMTNEQGDVRKFEWSEEQEELFNMLTEIEHGSPDA
jgi:hypothetical protein